MKIKSRDSLLNNKKFMDYKDNATRIKRLKEQTKKLSEDDFDNELDDMKITKLEKYKDMDLVMVTESDLKEILPNYDLKEGGYLSYLGINKKDKDTYSLQLDIYTEKFIKINLNEITFEENVDVLFNLYDNDHNGKISKEEFNRLMSLFSKFNQLEFSDQSLDVIADYMFKEIDRNNRGYIDKTCFTNYMNQYKDRVGVELSLNPFKKINTIDAVSKVQITRQTTNEKYNNPDSHDARKEMERITRKKHRPWYKKFWELNKKMIIWTLIYFAYLVIFSEIHREFEGRFNTNRRYKSTLAARWFAGIIFFNIQLLLLFMSNAFITFISSYKWARKYLPLGDTKYYHSFCGVVLTIALVVHISLHIFVEFVEIERQTSKKKKDAYVTVAWLIFANETGLWGFFSTLVFLPVLVFPLIPYIREKKYEIFWYSHKLVYLGLITLLIHAYTPDTYRWPYFIYLIIPILIFIFELCLRLYRYFNNKTTIKQLKYLDSGVIVLELEKPKKFSYLCGQYASINIPQISFMQWHPFTFASSPEDDTIYFYISPAGDWTKELKSLEKHTKNNDSDMSLRGVDESREIIQKAELVCRIDGPFGAPADSFKDYEHLIFIASGVGATPFSSILVSMIYNLRKNKAMTFKSLSFYWLQRQYGKTDYLGELLEELQREDKTGKLFDINVFITGAQPKYDLRYI
jgi:predicted ferric reductase